MAKYIHTRYDINLQNIYSLAPNWCNWLVRSMTLTWHYYWSQRYWCVRSRWSCKAECMMPPRSVSTRMQWDQRYTVNTWENWKHVPFQFFYVVLNVQNKKLCARTEFISWVFSGIGLLHCFISLYPQQRISLSCGLIMQKERNGKHEHLDVNSRSCNLAFTRPVGNKSVKITAQ